MDPTLSRELLSSEKPEKGDDLEYFYTFEKHWKDVELKLTNK